MTQGDVMSATAIEFRCSKAIQARSAAKHDNSDCDGAHHSEAFDATLIERIARGDKSAMRCLYGRHNVRIYRFILRLTGDAGAAEDLVSDVFLDIWRCAARFEKKSRVSTWLLAIARHKALSALRRRPQEPLTAAAAIEDPSDNPEAAAQKQHRNLMIRKCLARLSPAHREVIDLVYYHDKSVDDVARIVGVSSNTVKTRVFYARGKLARFLQEAGIDGL
jgi:RNA polymerase sigma-70 factor (ECF subfamily)